MDRIDLEEPRFTQADAVQLVPGVTRRTLQNWVQRALLELAEANPGKGAVRLHSGLGIVVLRFMQVLVETRIPPSAAREMASEIVQPVLDLHRSYQAEKRAGRPHWNVDAASVQSLRRAYITVSKGKYRVRVERGDLENVRQTATPEVYIVVQFDMLCLRAFNRIYEFIASSRKRENDAASK